MTNNVHVQNLQTCQCPTTSPMCLLCPTCSCRGRRSAVRNCSLTGTKLPDRHREAGEIHEGQIQETPFLFDCCFRCSKWPARLRCGGLPRHQFEDQRRSGAFWRRRRRSRRRGQGRPRREVHRSSFRPACVVVFSKNQTSRDLGYTCLPPLCLPTRKTAAALRQFCALSAV